MSKSRSPLIEIKADELRARTYFVPAGLYFHWPIAYPKGFVKLRSVENRHKTHEVNKYDFGQLQRKREG